MPDFTFHLIANAHLDPVWLWDWREGLNEGLITCRTMLDLMDEDPDFTFIRGEAAIYEHIERTDPSTFERMAQYVKQGRWDVVGGTYIQPDTNLPATETLARHFLRGRRYFHQRFGVDVTAAWAADSFGHSAGLPEILAAAGMEFFAFTRPAHSVVPIEKPAFWWEGPGGSRVLAYRPPIGWYGCERHELLPRLDQLLGSAPAYGLHNIGVFYGLGNHGGGTTRRHLDEITRWAEAHPNVNVVHSGLHRFFHAIKREVKQKGRDFLPVHRGELNFVLRGCYTSVAKAKFIYRKAEASVMRAERTSAAVAAAVRREPADLAEAWDDVLFNSFHDVLPGSSIERATDEQIAWLGGTLRSAQQVEFDALNALAARVDTTVQTAEGDAPSAVSMLLFNPHPVAYRGLVELEASLDYRPIFSYQNRAGDLPIRILGPDGSGLPFQVIPTETACFENVPWRRRVVVPVELPPCGWSVLEMGYVEGLRPPQIATAVAASDDRIDNGIYVVAARPGDDGIAIFRNGRSIFGDHVLHAITVEDPWGSWGGMSEEAESIDLSRERERWNVTHVETLERGPLRASLFVIMEAGRSRLEMTFLLCADRDAVDVRARVLWNERSARLKLVMPAGEEAEFDVPGASVKRGPMGEVPGGRWVEVMGPQGRFGFASDSLYGFDCKDGALRPTVVRASRYADDSRADSNERLWRPAVDAGELKFRFAMNPGGAALRQLAIELEQPVLSLIVPPAKGKLPRTGSLAALVPDSLELLALKPAEDGSGYVLRVRETTGRAVKPRVDWMGSRIQLSPVSGHQIATWRITKKLGRWRATIVPIDEKKRVKAPPRRRRRTATTTLHRGGRGRDDGTVRR